MRLAASTLIADAFALWRTDRDVLVRLASVFVLLPVLAVALLLEPVLAKSLELLPLDDAVGRLEISFRWMTANAPWLLLVQFAACFSTLTTAMLYLDRPKPIMRDALRRAGRYLPAYLAATALVSLFAMIGVAAFIVGYFYVLGRLSLVAPVMAAEREMNPLAAIGRSFTLTRGHGLTLMAVMMIILLGGYIAQSPFAALDDWMAIHAPNPVARAIVDIAGATVSALVAMAGSLVQVAAWGRLNR